MFQGFTEKEVSLLRHALRHVKNNKIHDPDTTGGWYAGNKAQFIKRHKATIEFLEMLIGKEGPDETK
jgi:hypothetical protein